MERITAEYTITVKIEDVMVYSDEETNSMNIKIKELGQKRIKNFLTGKMFDPEGKVINEEIKITSKGLSTKIKEHSKL